MGNLSLSAITKGSEEIAISRVYLDNTVIHTNQMSNFIDRRGHSDRKFSFGSWKSCDGMIIYLGGNTNNRIPMIPLRVIGSITSHITSLESGTGIGQNGSVGQNSGDGTPPSNIRSFVLFDRRASDLYDRNALCHGK